MRRGSSTLQRRLVTCPSLFPLSPLFPSLSLPPLYSISFLSILSFLPPPPSPPIILASPLLHLLSPYPSILPPLQLSLPPIYIFSFPFASSPLLSSSPPPSFPLSSNSPCLTPPLPLYLLPLLLLSLPSLPSTLNNVHHIRMVVRQLPEKLQLEEFYQWLDQGEGHEEGSSSLRQSAKTTVSRLLESADDDFDNKVQQIVEHFYQSEWKFLFHGFWFGTYSRTPV